MSTTQQPNSPPAAEGGLPEHIQGLLSSVLGYFHARAELAGIEGKEAAVVYGKVFAFLAAAVALLLFGYVFLWIGLVAVIAHLAGVYWGWPTLGVGVLHLLGVVIFGFMAKAKWGQPVFPATLREFKKDQEWLSNPKQTARHS